MEIVFLLASPASDHLAKIIASLVNLACRSGFCKSNGILGGFWPHVRKEIGLVIRRILIHLSQSTPLIYKRLGYIYVCFLKRDMNSLTDSFTRFMLSYYYSEFVSTIKVCNLCTVLVVWWPSRSAV